MLWHGNVFEALQRIHSIGLDLECYDPHEISNPKRYKNLDKLVWELHTYIQNNEPFIPNYGERYRYGERISTAFVESTVNEIISRRMVKKQQMCWTQQGAHLLLQVRSKTLDGDIRDAFCRWYPDMTNDGVLADGELQVVA